MDKFVENSNTSQRFMVPRQINFGQNRCPIMLKFILSEIQFDKLSFVSYFMKKYCLVLKSCYFKVYNNIWISLKIVNLKKGI